MAKQINIRMSLIDNISSNLKKINANLNASSKDFNKNFNRQLAIADKQANKMIKSFSNLGKVITTTVGAIGAGTLVKGLNSFKEFEKSLANTGSIGGFERTTKEWEQLEKVCKRLGATTSKTSIEIADAMGYMQLAGWNVNETMGQIGNLVKLSEATGIEMRGLSDLMTDSMAVVGLGTSETGGFLDKLAVASMNANANVEQLFETIIGSGAGLKTVNTDVSQMIALSSSLADVSKGSEAGTVLNSLSNRLYKTTGESAKALKGMKITTIEADGSVKSLPKLLDEIRTKLDSLSKADVSKTLPALFGQYKSEGASLIEKFRDGSYNKHLNNVENNSEGALDKKQGIQKDTLAYDLEVLKSTFTELSVSFAKAFGEESRGYIKKLSSKLSELTQKAEEISKKVIEKFKKFFGFLKDNEKTVKNLALGIGLYFGSFITVTKSLKGFNKLKEIRKDFKAVNETVKGLFNKKIDFDKVFTKQKKISNFIGNRRIVKDISNGIKGAGNFIGNTKGVKGSKKLGALVAKPLNMKYGKIATLPIRTIAKPLNLLLHPIKSVTKAFKLLNLTFKANPIGFITTGVGLLIFGLVKLYKNSESFRNTCGKLWERLQELGEKFKEIWNDKLKPFLIEAKIQSIELLEKLKPGIEWLMEKIGVVAGFLIDSFDNVITFFVDFGMAIYGVFGGIIDFLTGVFTGNWGKAFDGLKRIVGGFSNFFSNTFKNIGKWFKDIGNMISKLFGKREDKKVIKYQLQGTYTDPINLPQAPNYNNLIPQNALGSTYFRGGLTTVNERGGEIINLPSGAKIIPADKTDKILNSSNKGITISVNLNGNVYGLDDFENKIGNVFIKKIMPILNNS